MLVVSISSKNLLFVKYFCIDNKVLIEFDELCGKVSEVQSSSALLLKNGRPEEGLYQLPIPLNKVPLVMVGIKEPSKI